ncbi:MAG: type I-C CRISPR-associated protein Cas7/Csd2 [Acidobacteriota bacterium]
MTETTAASISNRYDFVLLFDVIQGNPNGDPDAGNQPRIDPETAHGIVSDVSLKRKIRNFVALAKPEPGFEIYVKEKAILNKQHERAYLALDMKTAKSEGAEAAAGDPTEEKKRKKDKPKRDSAENVDRARQWMCRNFFDVRTFGAVMSTGVNCGQVRGPVQIAFARSCEPVLTLEHSITRMAVTTEKEAEDQSGENRTMGRKNTIPYGLYRAHGFISASLAAQTGFSEEDLELLWRALEQMFEHDRSAARGEMATRGLYVFKHDSQLGNAPAHKLFERISIKRREDDGARRPARAFDDYTVSVDGDGLPNGVELIARLT